MWWRHGSPRNALQVPSNACWRLFPAWSQQNIHGLYRLVHETRTDCKQRVSHVNLGQWNVTSCTLRNRYGLCIRAATGLSCRRLYTAVSTWIHWLVLSWTTTIYWDTCLVPRTKMVEIIIMYTWSKKYTLEENKCTLEAKINVSSILNTKYFKTIHIEAK